MKINYNVTFFNLQIKFCDIYFKELKFYTKQIFDTSYIRAKSSNTCLVCKK